MVFRKTPIRFVTRFGSVASGKGRYGDDVDFQLRVGKMAFEPSMVVLHKVPHERCTAAYARHYAFGQGMAEMRYRISERLPKRPGRIGRIAWGAGPKMMRAEVLAWGAAGFLRGMM